MACRSGGFKRCGIASPIAVVAGDGSALLAYEAAWCDDLGESRAQEVAAMAFIFASETAFRTCREALQFHGGYGVTLEYDIQMFFRRAKAWPLAIGDIRASIEHSATISSRSPVGTPMGPAGQADGLRFR